MNATELSDLAYAEKVAKLQQKLFSNAINQAMYDEEYENLRSSWLMEQVKERSSSLLMNK